MQSGINTTHTIKSANRCLVLDLMRKSEALTIEEIIRDRAAFASAVAEGTIEAARRVDRRGVQPDALR